MVYGTWAQYADMKVPILLRALPLLLLALAGSVLGQSGLYPFTIDQDALAGAPDFSSLNRTLTAADALIVRDGHFYRVDDNERVRLFGVNLAFDGALPLRADAARVARRLRKHGINLVRLHHLDTQPDASPSDARSLLTTGPYPTLNAESVALLRNFLDALRLEGIYANLNLHVGYTFRPAVDGVPAIPAGATFPSQSKPLHIFQPRMVELQTRFARQVLDALRLSDDPVLAMVEINNESSLLRAWQAGDLDKYLFPEYAAELGRQWNAWLAERYATTAQVAAAWGGAAADGPELLANGSFSAGTTQWQMEIHAPAQATLSVVTDAGASAARVAVTQTGGLIFLKQVNFSLERNAIYEAACEARAEVPAGQSRSVDFDVREDVSPYRVTAIRSLVVTNQWQRYTFGFESKQAMNGIGRFALRMDSATGVVLVRNCSLRRSGRGGLAAGETLGSISLLGETELATQARANDYLSFLAQTDRTYLAAMRAAVRESVPRRLVAIAGTQMEYGGLLNLDSHVDMDYHDSHFYVDHYTFPNARNDRFDWRIANTSGIGSGLTELLSVAASREAGRPYTISEFNQPWPNTQAAEVLPVVAAFAGFQDWDAILYFAYDQARAWNANVGRGFNLNSESQKLAQVGQAAWLYRTGAVRPGRDPITLPITRSARLKAGREKRHNSIPAFLDAEYSYAPNLAFVRRVSISRSESDAVPALPRPSSPYVSDTNELTYELTDRIYRIHSERVAGVLGYLGTAPRVAGPLSVELSSGARGFAAVVLTPLDGETLARSRRLLLTAPGYTFGTMPNRDRQVLTRYLTTSDWFTLQPEPGSTRPSGDLSGGVEPNWMEPIDAAITLNLAAASEFVVFPLDRTGARLDRVSVQGRRFRLQSSPWYEIVAASALTASRAGSP